jgi:hypothetical protein
MNNRTYLAVNSYQDDFGEISRWRVTLFNLSYKNIRDQLNHYQYPMMTLLIH